MPSVQAPSCFGPLGSFSPHLSNLGEKTCRILHSQLFALLSLAWAGRCLVSENSPVHCLPAALVRLLSGLDITASVWPLLDLASSSGHVSSGIGS